MTVAEILANEDLRLREFPVAREQIYLGHAGVCALPRCVAEKSAAYAQAAARGDQEKVLPTGFVAETRQRLAQLLQASVAEVALVGPTSLALSYIAGGLSFRKGANVLVYFDDYPSNVYPWLALADRGVEVRLLNPHGLGKVRLADVIGRIDEDTALVALASCHFVSGWRIEIDAIGRALRERDILFCVDGIQTLGAFPTTVEHVDFLAADAHKWLLGPCAAGVLYVRREVQERLAPIVYGWFNVDCPDFVASERMVLKPDARRYEAGSTNLLGLVGMRAGVDLLMEVGIEAIGEELLRKRAWVVPALQRKGFTVLHADAPPEHAGGITTFYRPDTDMAALHLRLEEAGVIASLRADRAGRRYLRFSPHFYNTDAELQRAIDVL